MDKISFLESFDPDGERLIYHYTSGLTGIDKILATGTLRLAPIVETNDPRENRDWSFISLSNREIDHDFREHEEVELSLNKSARHQSKIACFSMDHEKEAKKFPEDILLRGFAKSRMWSQYGESHRGICFVFSASDLSRIVSEHVGGDSPAWALPVRYTDNIGELIQGQSFGWEEVSRTGVADYARSYVKKNFKALFFLKVNDYRDEREFRLAVHTGQPGYVYVPYEHALRAVILGVDFPVGLIPSARHFCANNEIPLVKLNWQHGTAHLSAPFES